MDKIILANLLILGERHIYSYQRFKKTHTMNKKSILNKLENLRDVLQEELDDREFYYDSRSDAWQESEKGDYYLERTDMLEETLGNLQMSLDSFEDFLGI